MPKGNDSGREDRVREVFALALEQPDGERAGFLAGACGGDARLREEVEGLLAALEGAGRERFLTEAEGDAGGEQPGDVIGRYKLLQRIGEGGFGSVYMAEQREPVKRKVALKVIKLGMDTKQVIARFEAERQALAMMDHPNIAKVLDAGATESGRPYFVMELVRGVRITEYCDKEGLSTRERLELFVRVCQAVQHAHQKGIIHRDIKPSNVLVTLHDGVPVPKVIDFGIAKATHAELTEKTLFTEYHQFIGTPQYMSPEQAELSGLDIDSRSDVYSLGVLLYELLTGTTPLARETLRNAALAEIQRMIREDEAPRPSTRVSRLSVGATAARGRRGDAQALRRQLRGDIDWIVMKALEKDRVRRYESPSAMARDLERHMQDEPVEAGPPSRLYRLRKFARRNRVAVGTALAVVVSLVGGLAAATLGWVQARREASNTRAVAHFYEDMLTSLVPYQPGVAPERRAATGPVGFTDLTVADLLLRSEPTIAPAFGTRPELEADVRRTIGWTLAGLGLGDDARRELREALELQRESLGPEHPETLETANLLAFSTYMGGRPAAAAALERVTLDARRRRNGADSPEVLASQQFLASMLRYCGELEEAESLLRDLVARTRRVAGEESYTTLWARQVLASVALERGRFDEAEAVLGEVAAKAAENYRNTPLEGVSLFRDAIALRELGRTAEARTVISASRKAMVRRFGEHHPLLLYLDGLEGSVLLEQGDLAAAEAKLRETLAAQEEHLGSEHFMTAITRGFLIRALLESGQSEEAEQLARELVDVEPELRGTRGLPWLSDRHLLARAVLANGRPAEAVELVDAILADAEELLPGGFAELPEIRATRGRCLAALGRLDEAERELARAHGELQELRGKDHPRTRACARALAELRESRDGGS